MENELTWRKASKSGNGGECVEVGTTAAGQVAGIRDSKSPERGMLTVTAATWQAFLADIKANLAHRNGHSQ
jgi:Domain of unknown function (DUF397)